MKKVASIILFLLILSPQKAHAESSYVLPYPGVMPGNKLYLLQEIKNNMMQYWYFGDFGQFIYNLKQSDKYLVEAKTLFEYKQYLLGYEALQKSDDYFIRISPYLHNAAEKGKNINEKEKMLSEAATKHTEVLESLQDDLPETFQWQPEKKAATMLHLRQEVMESIEIRKIEIKQRERPLVFNY